MVAFAGRAFLQCPLTADDTAFRQSVEMLDVNIIPQGGTAIAEAIKLSGGKGGRDDIKAGFLKVKDLPTPLGKFSFLETRDGNHGAALQLVKDGKFQIVP